MVTKEAHEVEPSQKPVVVIIDDNERLYEHLIYGLNKDFVEVIVTPPGEFDKEEYQLALEDVLENVEFSRVALVIADQFYDNHEAQDYTRLWLERLQSVNQDAVVIETSFWPNPEGVYDRANPVVDSYGDINNLSLFFRNISIKDKGELLGFARRLGNLAFREAQKADPNSNPDCSVLQSGYEKLMAHERFQDFLGVISEDDEDCENIAEVIHNRRTRISIVNDLTKDAQILHAAFVIVFHLEQESNPAYYSIPISRLRNYLGE